MEVQQADNGKNGTFFIEESGARIGEMTYVYAGPDKFIIDHTEVAEGNEGRGIGGKLVRAAVDFAREKGLKILPLCPFAKGVFQRKPEYADVLF